MAPSPSVSRWKAWLDRIRCRSPFWTRSRWHRLAGLATRLSYIYVGFMILLLLLENWFLFHPTPASEEWLLPPEGLQVEDVAMPSKLGHAVHGWWSKPSDRKPGAGAVLYFHGNAGNVSQRGYSMLHLLRELHLAVLMVDYPGYGRSQGVPTEAGCYGAGTAGYDWLTGEAQVPEQRIILMGGSLGCAIATELAVHHPARALVLTAPFTSVPDMAQKTFPWLPARWLVRNRMDNLRKIREVTCPVLDCARHRRYVNPFQPGRARVRGRQPTQALFPHARA